MALLKGAVELPRTVVDEILGKTSETSAFMRAGRRIELDGNGTDFITISGLDAEWVAEGAVKPLTQPSVSQKQIDAHTLVSKFVVSRQFAKDTGRLFDELIAQGPAGLAKAFDRTVAGFKGVTLANFDTLGGVATSVVTDYKSLVDAFAAASANGNRPTHIVATDSFTFKLAGLTYADGRPVFDYGTQTIFGVPVYTFKNDAADGDAAWLGNFDLARWGDVEGIEVKLDESATVNGVSMFDTNQVAVRIEARYGFRVQNLADYVSITTEVTP
jgi:HK97 family phage major capsid protein